MDLTNYFKRIGYAGGQAPSIETLRQLQQANLQAVPFENLDIPLGRRITLTLPSRYHKIVNEKRGGFCYELNSVFCWLLRELGFEVEMLAARVHNGTDFGRPFDHLLLLAHLDGQRWLTDVGFGDSYREPLLLNHKPQPQFSGIYQILPDHDGFTLYQSRQNEDAKPQYTFTLQPYQLSDYEEMCHYQQTSPDSGFTSRQVCTIATQEGRVTLSNGRLITTSLSDNSKTTTPITTIDMLQGILKSHFGFELPDNLDLKKLLAPEEEKPTAYET